jgi:hypothetical protein
VERRLRRAPGLASTAAAAAETAAASSLALDPVEPPSSPAARFHFVGTLGRTGGLSPMYSGRFDDLPLDLTPDDPNGDHELILRDGAGNRLGGIPQRDVAGQTRDHPAARTSPAQLYRLLDQTNYRKSVDRLLRLLHVLDHDVELVGRAKNA